MASGSDCDVGKNALYTHPAFYVRQGEKKNYKWQSWIQHCDVEEENLVAFQDKDNTFLLEQQVKPGGEVARPLAITREGEIIKDWLLLAFKW